MSIKIVTECPRTDNPWKAEEEEHVYKPPGKVNWVNQLVANVRGSPEKAFMTQVEDTDLNDRKAESRGSDQKEDSTVKEEEVKKEE